MEISIRRHAPLAGAYKLIALCTLAVATVAGCGGGGSDPTQQTTVSAPVAPQITAQPQNASVAAGQTATFSVTATGTAPLSYQWSKNATAISGATSASYTTPATAASDNGASFTVSVTNAAGSITSSAATLTVTGGGGGAVAPQITAQPQNASITAGQMATFSVAATGTAPLSYQWMKNTSAISGATSASYTTPATTASERRVVHRQGQQLRGQHHQQCREFDRYLIYSGSSNAIILGAGRSLYVGAVGDAVVQYALQHHLLHGQRHHAVSFVQCLLLRHYGLIDRDH